MRTAASGGRQEQRRHQQPETIAALEYAKQLYETFIPGTLSWLDPNNNKVVPSDGQISLTANGISVYYAALTSQDPAEGDGERHPARLFPLGFDGKARELNPHLPDDDLRVPKYPNAAQNPGGFMMEKEQYVPWQEASTARKMCHPLAAYEKSAFWTADPQEDAVPRLHKNGDAGGYALARYASAAARSPTSSSRNMVGGSVA